MSSGREREFRPPPAVGDPYRADPAGPVPFTTEGQAAARPPSPPASGRPQGHPPSHSPEYQQAAEQAPPPSFPPLRSSPQRNPAQRLARNAVWFGIASVFIFNIILGPIAFVMGAVAVRRGEAKNGSLAMILGALGTLVGVTVLILVSKGVLPSVDELLEDVRRSR